VGLGFVVADAANIFFLALVALCFLGLFSPPVDRLPDDEGADEETDLPAAFRYLANGG
jgi:hypothetical protein